MIDGDQLMTLYMDGSSNHVLPDTHAPLCALHDNILFPLYGMRYLTVKNVMNRKILMYTHPPAHVLFSYPYVPKTLIKLSTRGHKTLADMIKAMTVRAVCVPIGNCCYFVHNNQLIKGFIDGQPFENFHSHSRVGIAVDDVPWNDELAERFTYDPIVTYTVPPEVIFTIINTHLNGGNMSSTIVRTEVTSLIMSNLIVVIHTDVYLPENRLLLRKVKSVIDLANSLHVDVISTTNPNKFFAKPAIIPPSGSIIETMETTVDFVNTFTNL